MTTSFEVSQIQNQLSDAQSQYLLSLAAYHKAVSAYHSAIADILDWKNVKVEGIPSDSATAAGDRIPRGVRGESPSPRRAGGSPVVIVPDRRT